ncbi:hypothetical protein SARC_05600 [Sphaeroforma arctica JP610]|uniref:ATP-dependent RNA helicase n=1 Tax=Sphaeroforma arctica JP610 TaxID=667725 RepID=A0A0L0FZX4_9EUKA|nr:hypothetical protein SARC_05600 [Sphaeroforma arctica JP610]KNC82111.1 hypothetical protein SARC_05600 [Sphaeroforma arctica JP610]|eukprot:XP_014156013.1 hypothetical protein SARC_05600 [Sphaeroforma arctica JP610]
MKMSKFQSLGLDPRLVKTLARAKFSVPTRIQQLAIPHLCNDAKSHTLLGAETGSGKTLAYLLPTLQRLIESPRYMNNNLDNDADTNINREKALILLPTSELVTQVYNVASVFAKGVDVGVSMASRFHRMSVFENTRLIVGTPAALLSYPHSDRTEGITKLVLDEADLLLSPSMLPSVQALLADIGHTPQTILAAATLPTAGTKSLDNTVNRMFPKAVRLSTEGWHRTVSHLAQVMVRVRDEDKAALIADVLKRHMVSPIVQADFVHIKQLGNAASANQPKGVRASTSMPRVLVFANTAQSAEDVYRALDKELQYAGKAHVCALLHGQQDSEHRSKAWASFLKGEVSVLVCTDVAARGLDVDDIDLVVQYDFALNAVDYLHRVGRTARNGKQGVAVNLVNVADEARASAIDKFNAVGMEPVFSRRRSFRKHIKKQADRIAGRV